MAYTLRTPEEQQFMAEFQANLPAILDFRRRYPKETLEGAFYKVTGKEWMPGRSVQESNGQYEMTKDRTVKSVLGKYVALPAAYAAATMATGGAASPLLLGLGASSSIPTIGGTAINLGAGTGAAAGTAGAAAGTTGSILGALGMGSKSAALMTGLNMAGKLAGGAANQRAEDRGAQAEYDLVRSGMDANNTQTANAQALQHASARQQADQARMRQISSADMLGSSKPPTDPRARLSGAGYMSQDTIAMMRDRAMKALESGSDVPQLREVGPTPEMPQGTKTDSFLKALSMAGTGVGALRESGVLNRTQAEPARFNESVGGIDDVTRVLPQGQQESSFFDKWMAQQKAAEEERLPPNQYGRINLPNTGYF